MDIKKRIYDVFDIDDYLLFYKVMWYNVPYDYEYFLFWKKIKNISNMKKKYWFTYYPQNEKSDIFLWIIKKYSWVYKSIPFVKKIYLCNSISFDAEKESSDIDLFFVVEDWAIWRARFFSVFLFFLTWKKRSFKDWKQKFCLSFYVTESNQNLYWISVKSLDIYLIYWIAHLVLLYKENKNIEDDFIQHNKWWKWLLNNYPWKNIVNIGTDVLYWKTRFKKIIEFIMWWVVWKIIEKIIKILRLPIVIIKKKIRWNNWIIVSDSVIKYYKDIRQKIHLKYKIMSKNIRHNKIR